MVIVAFIAFWKSSVIGNQRSVASESLEFDERTLKQSNPPDRHPVGICFFRSFTFGDDGLAGAPVTVAASKQARTDH
jgi:hypothetical protein